MTYVGRKVISVIGIHTPLPFDVHGRLGYGFHPGPDLVLGQFIGVNLGGVISPTHVADLVDPSLEWANSAAGKGA